MNTLVHVYGRELLRPDLARVLVERVAQRDPKNEELQLRLLSALLAESTLDPAALVRATQLGLRLLASQPSKAQRFSAHLAALYLLQHQAAEEARPPNAHQAQQALEMALRFAARLQPESSSLVRLLVLQVQTEAGRLAEAAALLEVGAQQQQQQQQQLEERLRLARLAELRRRLGEPEAAVRAYRELLQLDPDHWVAWSGLLELEPPAELEALRGAVLSEAPDARGPRLVPLARLLAQPPSEARDQALLEEAAAYLAGPVGTRACCAEDLAPYVSRLAAAGGSAAAHLARLEAAAGSSPERREALFGLARVLGWPRLEADLRALAGLVAEQRARARAGSFEPLETRPGDQATLLACQALAARALRCGEAGGRVAGLRDAVVLAELTLEASPGCWPLRLLRLQLLARAGLAALAFSAAQRGPLELRHLQWESLAFVFFEPLRLQAASRELRELREEAARAHREAVREVQDQLGELFRLEHAALHRAGEFRAFARRLRRSALQASLAGEVLLQQVLGFLQQGGQGAPPSLAQAQLLLEEAAEEVLELPFELLQETSDLALAAFLAPSPEPECSLLLGRHAPALTVAQRLAFTGARGGLLRALQLLARPDPPALRAHLDRWLPVCEGLPEPARAQLLPPACAPLLELALELLQAEPRAELVREHAQRSEAKLAAQLERCCTTPHAGDETGWGPPLEALSVAVLALQAAQRALSAAQRRAANKTLRAPLRRLLQALLESFLPRLQRHLQAEPPELPSPDALLLEALPEIAALASRVMEQWRQARLQVRQHASRHAGHIMQALRDLGSL